MVIIKGFTWIITNVFQFGLIMLVLALMLYGSLYLVVRIIDYITRNKKRRKK